jgi:hypothetical protein
VYVVHAVIESDFNALNEESIPVGLLQVLHQMHMLSVRGESSSTWNISQFIRCTVLGFLIKGIFIILRGYYYH